MPRMGIRWGLAVAVALGLVACGYFLTWNWDKSLMGIHNFRQTQTAITSYWFIREGITLDYQTPVLGKPWEIPFEFPFYQILAALMAEITSVDLDKAGRAVSVAFWIACLFPLQGMLRWWVRDRTERWAIILLVWSSSTYLYFSDSFMMESVALFFSLLYLYSLVQFVRRASGWLLLLAVACGLMAGLQKPTTFLIAVVPALGFVGLELYRRRADGMFAKKIASLFVALAVPLAGIELWTRHADAVKTLNPLARHFITSQALTNWNFGTLAQRLSFDVWNRIGGIEMLWGFGRGSYWLLWAAALTIPLAIWRGRHRMEILILGAGYLTGPLLFTNLFYIQEYYIYENSLYLELAFGLAVVDLVESFAAGRNSNRKGLNSIAQVSLSCGILLGISAWGIYAYQQCWVPLISRQPTSEEARQALEPVAKAGNPQDVLLVYGEDWNASVAYYSGRKAIVDKDTRPLDDPVIQETLAQLSPEQHIAAMIVHGSLTTNAAFIQERVKRFHLESTPISVAWGDCYLKSP
jgi:hypothetical protein